MVDFNLTDGVVSKETVDLMKNRRKMAYCCLYTTIVLASLMLIALVFRPDLLLNYSKIESTIGTLILGWFSIIGLYFGASTVAEIFANKVK
jgi:hypothetical protein